MRGAPAGIAEKSTSCMGSAVSDSPLPTSDT